MLEKRDPIEQMQLIKAYLISGPPCLLVVACPDVITEEEIVNVLKSRLCEQVRINTFRYNLNPTYLEDLSLSNYLSTLPTPLERSVVFVFGLDNLKGVPRPDQVSLSSIMGYSETSKDAKDVAINSLNWGRESLKSAGYSVVLWVRLATPAELGNRAPDFFSWRNDVFDFVLPTDQNQRQQLLMQLGKD